ncbi:phosphatase PAP2 family protein [Streptomyces cacaoi]|uniref:phosphatase PAP2 family protein n=1 Tax=Streptomyces cacaoi TaxID=1898 RepID=UPI00374927A4
MSCADINGIPPASRVRVGAHYPHDALAGVAVGGLTALLVMSALRRRAKALVLRLTAIRLRPLPAVAP